MLRSVALIGSSLCFLASAEAGTRALRDKTPTPCKEKYDAAFVEQRAKTHLDRYATAETCGLDKPRLLMLLGGSGAGKGTLLKHLNKHGLKPLVPHGLDEYLDYLPEYQQTIRDMEYVYKDAADACYGGGAIPIAKAVQSQLIERQCDLFYEETGKNLDRILKRVLPPFVDAGYVVTIVLVDNLPSVAQSRAIGRAQKEGRFAPPDYIEGTFKNVFENYGELRKRKDVSESIYCDNSCATVKDTGLGSCLLCWEDTLEAGSSPALVPRQALLSTPKAYLKDASTKNRDEM